MGFKVFYFKKLISLSYFLLFIIIYCDTVNVDDQRLIKEFEAEEKEELLFSVGYSIDICRSYIKFLFYLLVFFLFLGYCFGRLNA